MKITTPSSRTLLVALSTIALSAPLAANALDEDSYLTGSYGVANYSTADFTSGTTAGSWDVDNGRSFSIAYGTHYTENLIVEYEFSRRKADLGNLNLSAGTATGTGGSISTNGLLVNAYYGLTLESKMSPFVTAGIGLLKHSATATATGTNAPAVSVNDNDTGLAYSFGVGATYDIADSTEVVLSYRHIVSDSPEFGAAKYDDVSVNELRLGFRFYF